MRTHPPPTLKSVASYSLSRKSLPRPFGVGVQTRDFCRGYWQIQRCQLTCNKSKATAQKARNYGWSTFHNG